MTVVVKKESSEHTYTNTIVEHTLDVNGKKIIVREETHNSLYGDDDHDLEIEEDEVSKTLTEEEREALDDELDSLVGMKNGESTEIEGYEV